MIGNLGTTGSIVGDVVNDGQLTFNRSDDLTFAGQITGSGALTKFGNGTLTLTADNTYSNGTVIAAGTLQLGNGGTTGTIGSSTVNNGGTLAFNRSDLLTFGADIFGTGRVVQSGSGTTVLTGTNSYEGGTIISGGTLQVTNHTSVGLGAVTLDGGVFQADGSGDLAFSNSFVINTTGGAIDNNGIALTISNAITDGDGPGHLTVDNSAGGGALILTNTNTYSGGTTICFCSTLQLGDATHTASILGAVTNDGVFQIVNADTSGITSITNEFGSVTIFRNSTTASTMTIHNVTGGSVEFRQTSSAGNATINNSIGSGTGFFNDSTAGNAIINNIGGLGIGIVEFNRFSRGGSATINNAGFSVVLFNDQTTLENARIINRHAGSVIFSSQSSAGTALASITNNEFGQLHFINRSTAGSETIYNNDFGVLDFSNRSTAGDAVIINSSSIGMAFQDRRTHRQCLHHHQEQQLHFLLRPQRWRHRAVRNRGRQYRRFFGQPGTEQ